MPERVLVVDDDALVRRMLTRSLVAEGFEVEHVADGGAALAAAEASAPDLVVLDVTMPGLDGLAVCRRLRANGLRGSIIMLTARDAVADRVAGLEAGADDYLVKPFHFEELVARIRAVLRRRVAQTGRVLRVADLELNPETREVRRGGREVALTPREFDLLRLLMEQPRRVFSKSLLIERVWGYDYAGDDNIVEVYVGHLREKLGDRSDQRLIRTVRGVGYALRDD